MYTKALCEALKALRAQHNLSQRKFAERLGLSQKGMAHWETGETIPTDANLEIVRREFGVDFQTRAQLARAERAQAVAQARSPGEKKATVTRAQRTISKQPPKACDYSLKERVGALIKYATALLEALDKFELAEKDFRKGL